MFRRHSICAWIACCYFLLICPARAQSWPAYILQAQGHPWAAVFPHDQIVILLGCPEIYSLWDGVPVNPVSAAEMQSAKQGRAVARLSCHELTRKFLVTDRGVGMLLVTYEDGSQRFHPIDSPDWFSVFSGPTEIIMESDRATLGAESPVHLRQSPGKWESVQENGCRGDNLMGYRANFVPRNSPYSRWSASEVCQNFVSPLVAGQASVGRDCKGPLIFQYPDTRCRVDWDSVVANMPLPFQGQTGTNCAWAVINQNQGNLTSVIVPGRWPTDGCSILGNDPTGVLYRTRFINACAFHDTCYSMPWGFRSPSGQPTNGQEHCDDNALAMMRAACGNDTACNYAADVFHRGMREGGFVPYGNAQDHRQKAPLPRRYCPFG